MSSIGHVQCDNGQQFFSMEKSVPARPVTIAMRTLTSPLYRQVAMASSKSITRALLLIITA